MSISFADSQTKINLMRAFAGESQARNRYTFAASVAKKAGQPVIADMFIFTAGQDKEHAEIFYNHLKAFAGTNITIDAAYPIDKDDGITTVLRAAQHNENEEYAVIYPSFANKAEEEGFLQIATSFRMIAAIEKTHSDRFGLVADRSERQQLFASDTSTKWMCLNCGHVHEGKEVPTNCPVCQHAQGYFIRLSEAPYTSL